MARIQYVSDIHLELRKTPFTLPVAAPYLALLGDIGDPFEQSYQEFLNQKADEHECVFVLAGNHEFYGHEYFATLNQISEICIQKSNLFFLHKMNWFNESFRVLGCTLWSSIPDEHSALILRRLNDFKKIRWNDGLLDLNIYAELFRDESNWLAEQIPISGQATVVLTHHAPIIRSGDPQYHGSALSGAFVNSLERWMQFPIHTWAFGHTHWQNEINLNGVRLVSNQVGYEHENIPRFNPQGCFEV